MFWRNSSFAVFWQTVRLLRQLAEFFRYFLLHSNLPPSSLWDLYLTFVAELVHALAKNLEVKLEQVSPEHPQTVGVVNVFIVLRYGFRNSTRLNNTRFDKNLFYLPLLFWALHQILIIYVTTVLFSWSKTNRTFSFTIQDEFFWISSPTKQRYFSV